MRVRRGENLNITQPLQTQEAKYLEVRLVFLINLMN